MLNLEITLFHMQHFPATCLLTPFSVFTYFLYSSSHLVLLSSLFLWHFHPLLQGLPATHPGLSTHPCKTLQSRGADSSLFAAKSICMAGYCSAGECVITFFYSVVPHLIFLQGLEEIEELSKDCSSTVLRNDFLKSLVRDGMLLMGCVDGACSLPVTC